MIDVKLYVIKCYRSWIKSVFKELVKVRGDFGRTLARRLRSLLWDTEYSAFVAFIQVRTLRRELEKHNDDLRWLQRIKKRMDVWEDMFEYFVSRGTVSFKEIEFAIETGLLTVDEAATLNVS